MLYVLSVSFGHRRYYLIDNQANLIVICPLNWINKHGRSAECCCQQKHEIVFTNPSSFVWVATLLTTYVYICFLEMKTDKLFNYIYSCDLQNFPS
jgi:hypothetical protein